MNLHTNALRAAQAATVLWTLKAIAIGTAGGLGRSPFEVPLFLLGLAAALVCALLLGASYAGSRSVPWKVGGAVLAVAAAWVYTTAVTAVILALEPADGGWVFFELNLWVLALTLLTLTWSRARRRSARATTRVAVPSTV